MSGEAYNVLAEEFVPMAMQPQVKVEQEPECFMELQDTEYLMPGTLHPCQTVSYIFLHPCQKVSLILYNFSTVKSSVFLQNFLKEPSCFMEMCLPVLHLKTKRLRLTLKGKNAFVHG